MNGPEFDLQCHSLESDGELAPAEVVAHAAAAGVRTLALTDHDTVDGVERALRAGERLGVRVVPAVEISALLDDREDLHVLGYCIDWRDAALLARLEDFRADRVARAERMVAALREDGLAVDVESLATRRREGLAIGRPHIASAVLAAEGNRARLESEGLADVGTVIEAYLVPGRPGFAARTLPDVRSAIELIHGAGGVAVWAHPFWDVEQLDEAGTMLRRFQGWGLDGVEAFYVTHDRDRTRAIAELAGELGMLRTGSSDFHGPSHPRFSRWRAFELHGCEPALGPIAG